VVAGNFLAFSLSLFFPACSRLDKLEKNLNPEQAKWLSEVRYIITPEERKISLSCLTQKDCSL